MKTIVANGVALILAGCAYHPYTHSPGGPFYFETFASNYSVPYTPKNEISKAEADTEEQNGGSYCIAFFNEQGLVSSFEKRLRNKTFFRIEYTYKDGRLVELRGIDADGKENVQTF